MLIHRISDAGLNVSRHTVQAPQNTPIGRKTNKDGSTTTCGAKTEGLVSFRQQQFWEPNGASAQSRSPWPR